ncbi:kinase-like domain-containing protein [Diplogelasinospora grovesii]|uniref:Kinase-like domain-containing protein n=1 Tax=Diplogelasinospora grovesii TaxID=303347 RepID=A0AAN6N050_9PEZI|nr:kinase-like domain-containing protein [Diplogelasinospora grovesii]
MASEPDKRYTLLDFKSLKGFWDTIPSKAAPYIQEAAQTKDEALTKLKNPISEPAEAETRPNPKLAVKEGSPWEHYEIMYQLRLGLDHRAIVAEIRKRPPVTDDEFKDVFSIRRFTDSDMKAKQDLFRDIRHQNFVPAHEIYWLENTYYVVLEHMSCSLYEVRGNEHLDELRLAAIIGQIVDGISYLEQSGLCYDELNCSRIFLGDDGIVRIGEQERCYRTSPVVFSRKNVRDLGPIVMDLITGDYKDDTNDLNRWSNAVDFAIKTASADSTADILKREVGLKGVVNFSVAKSRRGCRAMVDEIFDSF